jgi:hypothetical protein
MAAYGHTRWSRNLRAASNGRLSGRGHIEAFTTTEMPAEQRPPLIAARLQAFGTLPTVAGAFRTLPDSADHPTFAISGAHEPTEGPAT